MLRNSWQQLKKRLAWSIGVHMLCHYVQCEKIERRRGTLLGSIRMINSPVLHDADLKINRAL